MKEFYKRWGYQVLPELPEEIECNKILENHQSLPSMIVRKEYMNFIENGLIRGDIILLWWINTKKKQNKKPQYFLYKYGLNVNKEIEKLQKNYYIVFSKDRYILTNKGKNMLTKYNKIVQEHRSPYTTIDLQGNIDYHLVKLTKKFKSTGDCVNDQHVGREYERQNDYLNAIKAYNSAEKIAINDPNESVPPPNIYRRLAIIYRKLKDYDSEIKVIKTGLKYYPNNSKFQDRLIKAEKLKKIH